MNMDSEKLMIGAAMAVAAYFLLFRRASALNLTNGMAYNPLGAAQVSMVPTPANVISNNYSTLAEKVSGYGYNPALPAGSAGAFDPNLFYGNGGM